MWHPLVYSVTEELSKAERFRLLWKSAQKFRKRSLPHNPHILSRGHGCHEQLAKNKLQAIPAQSLCAQPVSPTSTVFAWGLPCVGEGGTGAACHPPWADTCISEVLRWAAEAGHIFMREMGKASKPL